MATASAPEGPIPGRDTRTQLFVGNLPYRVRWQDLKDLFRKAGTVLRADVSLGPDNRSRGYGTVLLATREDAARAVEMFNGYNWQTRILEVRLDRLPPPDLDLNSANASLTTPFPSGKTFSSYGSNFASFDRNNAFSPDPDDFQLQSTDRVRSLSNVTTRNLFVGNDLKDLFRQAGTIVRADVALGPDGRSRGFGTVSFANDMDAERAVNIFNGYDYNGRVLKVHYDKFSQSLQSQQTQSPLPQFTSPQPSQQLLQPHFLSSGLDSGVGASSHMPMPMPAPTPLSALERALLLPRQRSPSPFHHHIGSVSPYCDSYTIPGITNNVDGAGIQGDILIASSLPTSTVSHILPTSTSSSNHATPFPPSQQPSIYGNFQPSSSIQAAQPAVLSPVPLPKSLSSSSLAETVLSPLSSSARRGGPPPLPLSTKPSLSSVKTNTMNSRNEEKLTLKFGTSASPPSPLLGARPSTLRSPKKSPPSTTSMNQVHTSPTFHIPVATVPPNAPPHASEVETVACEETTQVKMLPKFRQNPSHPHPHPGPITLPSPPLRSFPVTSGAPISPFQGLPPITPSMPTFTFVPQNATPPLNPHFLSPGVGLTPFSPPVPMSPGSYYHPDPRYHTLPWNPAPGAPIYQHPLHPHMYPIHGHSPLHSPSASTFFPTQPVVAGPTAPPTDYFSGPLAEGYFPPVPPQDSADVDDSKLADSGSRSNSDSTTQTISVDQHSLGDESDPALSARGGESRMMSKSSPGTSPDTLHFIAEELGRISIGSRPANNSTSMDDSITKSGAGVERDPSPPQGPQRTHSDESKLPTTSSLGNSTGNERKMDPPNSDQEVGVCTFPSHVTVERRASWTPEATKVHFRRELMSSATGLPPS
ncbi:hypothetical protein Clacol_009269 [Clathrus columnatus]|uniref:RRM domain-containing protein n=1 Tax=Clathrus columnatus TaxID=1419009 RepID=A0AAV5AQN0_9AGAM|nr:hypothetical protein Clacol_009269 [Clathrus columnatus]